MPAAEPRARRSKQTKGKACPRRSREHAETSQPRKGRARCGAASTQKQANQGKGVPAAELRARRNKKTREKACPLRSREHAEASKSRKRRARGGTASTQKQANWGKGVPAAEPRARRNKKTRERACPPRSCEHAETSKLGKGMPAAKLRARKNKEIKEKSRIG